MCNKSPAKIIGIIIFVIFAIFGFGAVTMLLWNWLIPALFSGPTVTYFQALGLIILSKILFSGGPGKHGKHHDHSHRRAWKKHLHDRIEEEAENISGTEDIKQTVK